MKEAILIFIRDEQREASQKSIGKRLGKYRVHKLYRGINRRLVSIARSTGSRTFVIKGTRQRGSHFGARLSNAFQSIFDQGFDKVVAVGNDCLEISPNHIKTAFAELNRHDATIGPDTKGGAYLIGFNKSAFDQNHFTNLQWQTSGLLDSLCQYLDLNGLNFAVQQTQADFDSYNEFLNTLLKCDDEVFKLACLEIIEYDIKPTVFNAIISCSYLENLTLQRRGPPASLVA